MARIVVTAPLFADLIERMEASGHSVGVWQEGGPIPREDLAAWVREANALLCLLSDRIDDVVLRAAPDLRIVANVAVGYENIDVDAARVREIVVTNTPDVLTETTADLTFGLLLAVARRIAEADDAVRRGIFPAWGLDQPLMGRDVHGKTLGIFGMGRIGTAVARRAHFGFGMRVIYHNRTRNERAEVEVEATWVPFDDLLAESDVVSIHAPGTPETLRRFDRAAFAAMKRSSILVNVARGSIVDEDALIDALERGLIAGAGLDVYSAEPNVPAALIQMQDRVVLTPHLGSATQETRHAMAALAVENVLAVLAGHAPVTPVR
jgi:glyoxylate reductase